MRWLLPLAALALAAGCGGTGGDGNEVFRKAQRGLADVQAVHADLTVHAILPIHRSTTVRTSDLPLSRLQVTRWVKHPERYDCDAGLECARGDLDVEAALRDLRPVLPSLPFEPSSITSAKVDVAIRESDGVPQRMHLEGQVSGLAFDVELRAV